MGIKVEIHHSDKLGNVCRTLFPQKITFRGKSFVIPRGFESDGASVPRFFWRIVCPPLDPAAVRAGVAHDYIYRVQPSGWTRKEADLMFLCFLIEDGLSPYRARRAYLAVRLFGWLAWWENRDMAALYRLEGGEK
ncbi:MAG: DUF1353 domain-containing protein [Lentisphaeria bacterium]|nr:DUF1353 domain-containing protein [Lentisphaeria bacterium]